ncbi:A-kinase anchor protein spoonbill [Lycorma delicatula]|uniref:A-kinase anchor protein spoonbill n=1 Tax=Lycorma delicatula TaxID=130591 RepID=UPI003F5115B4
MAPAQCPRQVLIWSIPAIAVLISLYWYKRRKTSLRSDPGGTTQQKSSELVDTHSSKTNCVTTVDSDKVIAAIEKAIRDIETSRAIQEVVSFEEEEESAATGEKSKQDIDISQEKKTVTESHSVPVEHTEKKFNVIETEKNPADIETVVDINSKESILTSAPETKECNDINFINLDNSFNNSTLANDTSKEIKITDRVESSLDIIQDSVTIIAEKVDIIKETEEKQESSIKKVADHSLNEIKVIESPVVCKKVNKVSGLKKRNKKPIKDSSSVQNNTGKTEIKDKDNVNERKSVLNSDSIKEEKLKLKKEPVVKTEMKNNKMELACSRVEQSGHNSLSSTVNGNEAGLEQKLATLGLESSHDAEGGERDSANHSPAEVMLASPSMSNFSDVHSEGSSDSGKGCSDIPDISTPPSQTPAGGSSVAGDLIPSVYEFIIPQHMVGRLIGRHGVFLHDIRSKTHTHIFIKRHPDTTKLKICAIEGAQQDVDAALAMIRQKFPIRRFPNLTLEKVTFVNIIPSLFPLLQEQFQIQLIDGVNNDVILSSLISAGHFFLQQPTHPSYQSLCQLNFVMNSVYSSPEAPPLDTPLKDAICAAPALGGWYRAQIINIDEDSKSVDVRFLDYGGFLTLETSALRQIRGDLMTLPFQAVECLLANVVPAGGEDKEWTEEARLFVQNLTCGQILQAHISEYTEQGMPLVFLYAMHCGQVVIVNQELVNRGFAETYTPLVSED